MTLEAHLNTINQIADFNQLLDRAHARVTFWGSRVIEVDGYSGSVYIDDVARKIFHFSNIVDTLSLQERIFGIDITTKTLNFYGQANPENSNCLTQLFYWLRNCCNGRAGPGWYLAEDTEYDFRSFPRTSSLVLTAPDSERRFENNNKPCLSEQYMRSLLQKA